MSKIKKITKKSAKFNKKLLLNCPNYKKNSTKIKKSSKITKNQLNSTKIAKNQQKITKKSAKFNKKLLINCPNYKRIQQK